VAQSFQNNNFVINNLQAVTLVSGVQYIGQEFKAMSLRNKVVVFILGAIAAVAGLSLAFTSLKHASIVVASAVWGS
jgi:uncharacterized membrane protein HdeD (DUF308 family)